MGTGTIVRDGSDVTIVTLSRSVIDSYRAAEALAQEEIDAEVIDLRSVVPLDLELILDSVAKTGRLVVVDEDYLSFGLSGEIATRTMENLGPATLRAVSRVAVPDVPIPAAASLESAVIPREDQIAIAVRDSMEVA
jgi:pyruvate dehydrogenase E1 component beta subunit